MSDAVANHETSPRVLVMMATYNGEKYVVEQIDSILAQEGVAVSLLISDDGSSDGTCGICGEYAKRCDNVTFRRNEKNKGLAKNFMDMVYEADAHAYDYFAFSDQDDYWLKDKMRRAVGLLSGVSTEPALYYSDVVNVDENLANPRTGIYASLFSREEDKYSPLITNWASGCTMVFNNALCLLAKQYSPSVFLRFHDSWMHLIATTCGVCIADNEEGRILRRISSRNTVGEKDLALSRERLGRAWRSVFNCDHHITEMAKELKKGFASRMKSERLSEVDDVIALRTSFFARLKMALRREMSSRDLAETVILKARILFNLL